MTKDRGFVRGVEGQEMRVEGVAFGVESLFLERTIWG